MTQVETRLMLAQGSAARVDVYVAQREESGAAGSPISIGNCFVVRLGTWAAASPRRDVVVHGLWHARSRLAPQTIPTPALGRCGDGVSRAPCPRARQSTPATALWCRPCCRRAHARPQRTRNRRRASRCASTRRRLSTQHLGKVILIVTAQHIGERVALDSESSHGAQSTLTSFAAIGTARFASATIVIRESGRAFVSGRASRLTRATALLCAGSTHLVGDRFRLESSLGARARIGDIRVTPIVAARLGPRRLHWAPAGLQRGRRERLRDATNAIALRRPPA